MVDKVIILKPEQRQTLELLLSSEKDRIRTEWENGVEDDTDLADAVVTSFQDIEPMTMGDWSRRITALEETLAQ